MAAGRACISTSGDMINSYSNFETEYQENLISERCQLMYNTWGRKRNWHLESSCNQQTFSEVSRDGKFVIGLIGKDGGYLELKNRAIQLYIPPGAMGQDRDAEHVFLYSDTIQCNFVYYDVIICGPPGLTFTNSVLLRFPKSKPRREESVLQYSTTIKLSVQKLGEPMVWKSLDTSTDGFWYLEDGDVFLHLNHFTGIKDAIEVQATPSTENQLTKTIYISAFLEQHDHRHFSLRVACSTYSALTFVTKEESDRSRKIGKPVKVGSYQSHDEVNIKIVECVDCKAEPSDYTIPVGDVVSDVGYIFRQFALECPSSNEAFLKFQVNVGDRTIHIAQVNAERSFPGTHVAVNKLHKEEKSLHDEYLESEFTHSPLTTRPILSVKLRRSLSIELDVLRESQRQGEAEMKLCDYRGLACLMGLQESYIVWLGAPKNCQVSASPTILLLNRWEMNCRKRQMTNDEALNELKLFLKELKHNNCIKIVDDDDDDNNKKKNNLIYKARRSTANSAQCADACLRRKEWLLRPRVYSAPAMVLL